MNRLKLSNILLSEFRDFLRYIGCTKVSVTGGHEKWKKTNCLRSIVIQTHKEIIPEIVLRSNDLQGRILKLGFYHVSPIENNIKAVIK